MLIRIPADISKAQSLRRVEPIRITLVGRIIRRSGAEEPVVETCLAILGAPAAEALGRLADPGSVEAIRRLAADYPEVSTRKILLQACASKMW
jgi:hypothetical protein